MRIVSWNMNPQGRDTWAFLVQTLAPDIALVQEAIVREDLADRYQILWTPGWPNGRWGSAILSRVGDLVLEWEDRSRGAMVVARGSVPSLGPVSIASIHARLDRRDHRVIPALRLTFDALRTHLGDRVIVGGDLNTARAAALAWPDNGHKEFWRDLEAWGFKEPLPLNGVERQSYWREWLENKPPTIGTASRTTMSSLMRRRSGT
jgi:exonuclease III